MDDGYVDVNFRKLRDTADTVRSSTSRVENAIQQLVILCNKNEELFKGRGGEMFTNLRAHLTIELNKLRGASARAVAHADNVGLNLTNTDMQMAKLMGSTSVNGRAIG